PDFIRQVQGAATKAGVDLQSIAPSAPSDRPNATGVREIAVTVTINGGFFRVEDFLTRLESLRRVVRVNAIALTPQTDQLRGPTVLQASLSMKMFVVQANASVSKASSSASPNPHPTSSKTP